MNSMIEIEYLIETIKSFMQILISAKAKNCIAIVQKTDFIFGRWHELEIKSMKAKTVKYPHKSAFHYFIVFSFAAVSPIIIYSILLIFLFVFFLCLRISKEEKINNIPKNCITLKKRNICGN